MDRLMRLNKVPVYMLGEQYRMHPEIAEFPSCRFWRPGYALRSRKCMRILLGLFLWVDAEKIEKAEAIPARRIEIAKAIEYFEMFVRTMMR